MLLVYRKRNDSTESEWHFHTRCSRWPETDYIQTFYYIDLRENERFFTECVKLDAATFGKPNV